MSNVIKAYSVRYDDEARKTIDTHRQLDIRLEQRKSSQKVQEPETQEGFVKGLQALVIEEISSEEVPSDGDGREQASKMIEDAKEEAQQILDEAKQEAAKLKSDAIETARKKGYDEGMRQAKEEAERLKAEYEEESSKLQAEYENLLKEAEPGIVELIASLIEKITGILVRDNEEVLFYLVNRALNHINKSEQYILRVSKEDYESISMRRNLLLDALGREVPFSITEDKSLVKNQCFIETDSKIINCSLDVQLNNLITDLKLIGGI